LNRRFYRKFILHKRTKATMAIASKIGEIANLLRNRVNHDSRKIESHPVQLFTQCRTATEIRRAARPSKPIA